MHLFCCMLHCVKACEKKMDINFNYDVALLLIVKKNSEFWMKNC